MAKGLHIGGYDNTDRGDEETLGHPGRRTTTVSFLIDNFPCTWRVP
jgi:hypothetical protein